MQDRVQRMKRILTVQEQMHKVAEQRLNGLVAAEQELRAHEEALVTALDEATLLHGLFVEQMAKRVRRIAVEAEQTAVQVNDQREKLKQETLKLRRVEDAARRIERDHLRMQERKRLEEAVQPVSRIGNASLP